MKKISTHFNKKSRLTLAPELSGQNKRRLTDFDAQSLSVRLAGLLTMQNDFYPCFDWTFPPPLLNKSNPPTTSRELFAKPSVIPGRYSIYLHSPFCKSLCSFCYYSVIPGKGIELAEKYIDYLIREMAMHAETFRGQVCESVYFGGGTPSHLDDELLARVFTALHQYFDIEEGAEITIEASPGTLPREKSIFLKSLGVNRLSYGIQTLDANLLATMNRNYSVDVAIDELRHAIDVIGNVNVDTMYGFEDEREDTLLETLQHFYQIGVPSFSIYALDRQRTEAKHGLEPPRDESYTYKINQFARAEELLGSWGYRPVLQNVFIDPERASYRHQLRRWDNLPLLAMGINSQGYAPQRPYQNAGSLKSYYQLIDEGKLPVATMDILDSELELCRELTSKLRFTYVSIDEFKYKYGIDVESVFSDLIKALQFLGFVERRYDILRMTDKAAYYNNIIPMLFAPDSFKEKLLELPEEYLETFPVPHIMTRLGKAQSCDIKTSFSTAAKSDRRIHYFRRRNNGYQGQEQRKGPGRRSSDTITQWSAHNPLNHQDMRTSELYLQKN